MAQFATCMGHKNNELTAFMSILIEVLKVLNVNSIFLTFFCIGYKQMCTCCLNLVRIMFINIDKQGYCVILDNVCV